MAMMTYHLVFSGQGAQTVGMGRSLYEASPAVRERYREATEILGWDVARLSFEGPEEQLTETRHCQPALFVHGYCLFELLKTQPGWSESSIASVFGLSLGELTALAGAGAFSFADGLRVVAERGRLMQEACETNPGGMAALIGGSREAAEALAASHDVDVANFNCPGQIVISGDRKRIEQAVAAAADAGFRMAKALNVAGAYHSRLMESAALAFDAYLSGVSLQTPRYPVYTNTTGQRVVTPDAIREALVKQVTGSVYFEDNLRNAVLDTGVSRFLECGPGAVLSGFIRRTDKSWSAQSLSDLEDFNRVS